MNSAPAHQRGLALGAWGAVQATAGGIAIGSSGVIRDVVAASMGGSGAQSSAIGYTTVYAIEIVMLAVALVAMMPLIHAPGRPEDGFVPQDLRTPAT
jgi:BCD family chlorophyll transporter-like MFS transporter